MMTDKQEKALYIARQLLDAGMTLAGASGVIANIEAESAFKSTNVQDSYERGLCMNDEQYTTAVDNGTYTRFTVDKAGYGLAQWTANDRKEGMLKFHRKRGASIGDFKTQVSWLITEIRGYNKAFQTVTQSNDPYLCGYNVCKYYEFPADTENAARYRGGLAQDWFAWLEKQELSQNPYTPPTIDPVQGTFPPDPSIFTIQLVMQFNGYWERPDGHKSKEFFDRLKKFVEDMEGC